MEDLQQRWKDIEAMLQERFGKTPDMEGILFLIGVNELGAVPEGKKFTKEQKQDLMHVAVCTLLSQMGYFEFVGRDADGWPHFQEKDPVPPMGMKEQEEMLRACIIHYFEDN